MHDPIDPIFVEEHWIILWIYRPFPHFDRESVVNSLVLERDGV